MRNVDEARGRPPCSTRQRARAGTEFPALRSLAARASCSLSREQSHWYLPQGVSVRGAATGSVPWRVHRVTCCTFCGSELVAEMCPWVGGAHRVPHAPPILLRPRPLARGLGGPDLGADPRGTCTPGGYGPFLCPRGPRRLSGVYRMNGCEAGGVRMRGAGHGGHFALCARAR